MVDYMDAIKKPFSDGKIFGIGTILSIIPIVNLIVSGYGLKVAEDTIKNKNQLREWKANDVVEYIIKYIMSLIISLGYLIIPLILIGVGIGSAFLSIITNVAQDNIGTNLIGIMMTSGPIVIIGILLMIIAMILLPMALMKFLKSGDLKEAFNIQEVIGNVLTTDYIVTLIVLAVYGMVLGFIASVITGALIFVPVIGWIIALLVMGAIGFALTVTSMTAIAQTVK